MAGPTVRFLGRLPDHEVKDYLAHCRAFIFPGEEDFGIAPLEAQATGRPVIAYAGGGALETIVEGVTGTFFHQPTADALATTLQHFDERTYDPITIRRHAERFDTRVFMEAFASFVATHN
jgi:glycosyltransferase involved in cell wall biosynthesis